MGYASVFNVDQILAQALTNARPESSARFNLVNINNVRDLNLIPNSVVEDHIRMGDNQIDGIVSQMYMTPLKRCANGEWKLDTDINEYNQLVEVNEAVNFSPGDKIFIRDEDSGIEEIHTVKEIIGDYSISTVDNIITNFSGSNIRVVRIQFPPPIEQISARLAASFIYDKFFASQNSPNVSDYGKEMRKIATQQLNDILNGRVVLKCQRRIGDRFGNPWLSSNYSLFEGPQDFNSGERNMSKL